MTRQHLVFVFCSVMDGMAEACVKGGVEACYASVSCACALLAALDQLLQGHGLQPEQVRPLLAFCPPGLLGFSRLLVHRLSFCSDEGTT